MGETDPSIALRSRVRRRFARAIGIAGRNLRALR
jgi:hypothetical protein